MFVCFSKYSVLNILCMDSCTNSASMCSGKVHVFFCTYLMCILIATGSVRVGVNLIHVAISYSFSQPPHLPPLGQKRGQLRQRAGKQQTPVVSRRSETTTQSDSMVILSGSWFKHVSLLKLSVSPNLSFS